MVICFDDPSETSISVLWGKGSLVSVNRPSLSEKEHCPVTTLRRTTDSPRKLFLCQMLQSPIFGCFKQKTNAFVPVCSFCNNSSDTHSFHHHLNFAYTSCHLFRHFPTECMMMWDTEAGPLTGSVNTSKLAKALERNLLRFLCKTRGWTKSSPFQPKLFYERHSEVTRRISQAKRARTFQLKLC